MKEAETIRRSPIVIVRNLIAVEFAASALYFLAGSLAYYARIWRGLPLGEAVPFQVAQVVFLFAMQTVLVFYIFLMWWRQTIRVTADQLQERHGVILQRHVSVARSHIASVVFSQSFLGRLTHYGTVTLKDSSGTVLAKFSSLPEPENFIDTVMGRAIQEAKSLQTAEPSELLTSDEHENLERKSTFRWDIAGGKVNRAMEKATMKTVAAFMNSGGGHLILGVGDDRSAVGLEQDYATLARKDTDGFVNHFGNVFNAMIGPHLRHLVQLRPFKHQERECMLVAVSPSTRPAYLTDEGKEEFFVRTGNGTTALKVSEAAAYIETHWQNR